MFSVDVGTTRDASKTKAFELKLYSDPKSTEGIPPALVPLIAPFVVLPSNAAYFVPRLPTWLSSAGNIAVIFLIASP